MVTSINSSVDLYKAMSEAATRTLTCKNKKVREIVKINVPISSYLSINFVFGSVDIIPDEKIIGSWCMLHLLPYY